jgi:tetratricopeptide (TPR) repeat protein
MMARRVAAALAVTAILAAGAEARAQGAEADRLFEAGRKAALREAWEEACADFAESYRLDPAPGTLLNMGDCEEHLGHLQRAYESYRTAISRMSPDDDRVPRAHGRMAAIEQRAGRLTVNLAPTAPDGTVVSLDGEVLPKSRLGMPLFVEAGKPHTVRATAVGYYGERIDVTLAATEARTINLTPGASLEEVAPDTPKGRTSAGPWLQGTGLAAIVAGGLALWGSSLAGVVAIEREGVRTANCDAQNYCNAQGYDAAKSGQDWATASTALFVGGLVLVAGGVTTYLVGRGVSHRSSVGIAPVPGGAWLRGTF